MIQAPADTITIKINNLANPPKIELACSREFMAPELAFVLSYLVAQLLEGAVKQMKEAQAAAGLVIPSVGPSRVPADVKPFKGGN